MHPNFFDFPVLFVTVYQQSHTASPRSLAFFLLTPLHTVYKRCALHTSGYTMLPFSRSGAHRTPGWRGLLYGYICKLMIQSRDSCRAAGAGLINTVAKSRSGFSGQWKKKSKQFPCYIFLQVKCQLGPFCWCFYAISMSPIFLVRRYLFRMTYSIQSYFSNNYI